jgi:hypothetical protein
MSHIDASKKTPQAAKNEFQDFEGQTMITSRVHQGGYFLKRRANLEVQNVKASKVSKSL